jgi:hypothetical protein
MATRTTRVFVSFDFDEDQKLKTFILAQAKNADSPFEIENWSLNEPAPQRTWQEQARERIARADVVRVIVGPHSYKSTVVLAEVAIAKELRIPVYQVIGYRDASPSRFPGPASCTSGTGRRSRGCLPSYPHAAKPFPHRPAPPPDASPVILASSLPSAPGGETAVHVPL